MQPMPIPQKMDSVEQRSCCVRIHRQEGKVAYIGKKEKFMNKVPEKKMNFMWTGTHTQLHEESNIRLDFFFTSVVSLHAP